MATEQITITVDAEVAQAFRSASDENRKKFEAMLSVWLREATDADTSLQQIMDEISDAAQARGLTPEIARSILDGD